MERAGVRPPPGLSAKWLYGFLLVQFVCVGALIVEQLGSIRIGFRILTFASSLGLLLALFYPSVPAYRRYPARILGAAFLAVLFLGMLHPSLNSPLAGAAHVALNLAIWAPLFWVQRFAVTTGVLYRVVLMIWGFNTLSATVGVLQVYFPDRFMPDPQFIRRLIGDDLAEGLKIQLDNGQSLFRPMGLSDSPGGAGTAGVVAFVTGLGLAVTDTRPVLRLLGVAGAALGMFCIAICQVRAALVVAGVDLIVILGLMALRGKLDRVAGLLIAAGLAVAGGFLWVMTVGSAAVGARLATLTEDSAVNVYQANRGRFLEETIQTQLPTFPMGAGLGRWGMMNNYFGNRMNLDATPLWAEIQSTAWVYDGGFFGLVLGYAAVIWACYFAARVALTSRDSKLADLATIITAVHLGTLAQTFGYIPFIGQVGLLFWFLNAVLFAAVMTRRPARPAWPSRPMS